MSRPLNYHDRGENNPRTALRRGAERDVQGKTGNRAEFIAPNSA